MPPKSHPTDVLEWPLRLVGLSDRVTDWLRQAGLPVADVGQDRPMLSALGLNRKRSSENVEAAARFLLYDSRSLWSRGTAKSQRRQHTIILDVTKLRCQVPEGRIAGPFAASSSNPSRATFLDRLKKSIETSGGVWVRLADLPFPHQGLVCLDGELPGGSLPKGDRLDPPARLEAIRRQYLAGLPLVISAPDLSAIVDHGPAIGLESRGFPLLWRADRSEFDAWWRQRGLITVRVWQSPTQYRVDCSKTDADFCPALEIWRGNHVARVPLHSNSVMVQKEGLVFQQQSHRHPAGFTAGWPDRTVQEAGQSLLA